MKVFICDPGLRSKGSHHFNWVVAVRKEFRRLGIMVRVYAYGGVEPGVQDETGAAAYFADFTYQKHDADEERNWLLGNESFRKDLENLNCEIANSHSLVIVPAVTQNQLDGVAQWYEAIAEPRPNLAVSLMFQPQWTPWGDRAIRGPEFYARAIDRLIPWIGQSVLLYTENREAQASYEQLTSAPIAVAPIPWGPRKNVTPKRLGGPIRFGYLGHARAERGFALLPPAVEICRAQGLLFDLIVQISNDESDAAAADAGRALRSNLAVTPIIGSMNLDQYYRVLDFCDVVLLPYDPSMYRFRGSGLFAEAVAHAKPVIISGGTAMENAANRRECTARVCEFNPEGLARAMCEVASCSSELEAQAKTAAQKWSETNNANVFCRQLLAFAQVYPPVLVRANGCENEHIEGTVSELHTWTDFRAGACYLAGEAPLSIQGSKCIEFIPKGLHSSRGLVVDAGPVLNSDECEAVALSLELNGHRLGSVTVKCKRRAHLIRGPFPFLRDGLPTTLKIGVTGGEGDKTSAVTQVYGIRFLRPAWRRRLFSRLLRSEKFMAEERPEAAGFSWFL